MTRMRTEHRDSYKLRRVLSDKYVKEMDTGVILDIGANMGEFTVAAAALAPRFQVVAVEPTPVTYWLCRLNLHLNGLRVIATTLKDNPDLAADGGSVVAINAGVGDGSATTTTVSFSTKRSQNAVTGVRGPLPGWDAREVEVVTLSSLIRGHKVGFFKIDCEACEFQAIPTVSRIFADTNQIALFGAEIHQSVLDPNVSVAAMRPSPREARETLHALRKRGCPRNSWQVAC